VSIRRIYCGGDLADRLRVEGKVIVAGPSRGTITVCYVAGRPKRGGGLRIDTEGIETKERPSVSKQSSAKEKKRIVGS